MLQLPPLPAILDSSSDEKIDYFIFVDELKWNQQFTPRSESKATVGEFRKDLRRTLKLRNQNRREERSLEPEVSHESQDSKSSRLLISHEPQDSEDKNLTSSVPPLHKPFLIKSLKSSEFPSPLHSLTKTITRPPANPLIDQHVKVMKPTSWIECVQRESRRIFIRESWIVARITLPPIKEGGLGSLFIDNHNVNGNNAINK